MHVLGPGIEVPVLGARTAAASGSTHVEVDDLGHLGELGTDMILVEGVIGPRPGVQEQHDRPLAHVGAVRHDLRPLDVEEQLDVSQVDLHAASLPSSAKRMTSSTAGGMSRKSEWRVSG